MTRKKVIIQARELSEMDVNIISLVKRGANRIPFRIVKSDGESTMNISNLFVWKQEPQLPAVVACVLAKTANHDAYTKALTEGGFEVDHVNIAEDETVTLMFTKSDEMEDAVALKVSDDAALIVVGVEKGLLSFPDSNSFIENITKAGFAPSYHIANEILNETVGNIIFSEGDAAETKEAVTKAIADFGGYIEAILSTIPVQAFKAEEILAEVQKGLLNAPAKAPKKASKKKPAKDTEAKAKQEGEDGDEEDDADAEDSSGADENGDDESGDDENGGDDAESSDDDSDGDDSEEVSKDPKDKDKDDAIAAMSKSLSGIAEGIEELKTSQTDAMKVLSDRLTDLEAKVKKTDEALAGTTASADADDADDAEPKKTKAVKWDNLLNFGDVEQY